MLLLVSLFYGIVFSSLASFGHLTSQRISEAFYEKSRKKIVRKWRYIASGRSSCDSCGQKIGFPFVLPVIGYFISCGKCRHCGIQISSVYPLEEFLAFIYGFSLYAIQKPSHIEIVLVSVFFILCYIIAFLDYRFYLIPVECTVIFLLLAIAEKFFQKNSADIWMLSSTVAISWFFLFLLLYRIMPSKLGQGDLYLTAVLVFASDFPLSLLLPTMASVIAIIYFFIINRKKSWKEARLDKIPFGLFLSLAYLIMKWIPIPGDFLL